MGTSILGQELFPDALSTMEIEHFFSLSEDELAAVRRRRTVLNRLALALQIGFLKMTGGTLNSVEIIPRGIAIIGRAQNYCTGLEGSDPQSLQRSP